MALIGIGTIGDADASPLFAGVWRPEDITQIKAHSGVGHICGEHYGPYGVRLPIPVNERVMSIGLKALHQIPEVVGVAGRAAKAPAIAAALRGGYFRSRVTDNSAAQASLDMT